MIHWTDGLEGCHSMQKNQTVLKPEFRKNLARCYVTMCKTQPFRLKSNILFVPLWHPGGHAGSRPVRIDVNHQKSSLGKFEKSDWSVLTKYKDLWHHGKPFFLSSGTKKPRGSPAPLSHLCSQLQCGNIVSIKTLIVCKHCCMVKAQWYLLWLQLCQIGSPSPASPPLFTIAHGGDESLNANKLGWQCWQSFCQLYWDPPKLQSICKHHDY